MDYSQQWGIYILYHIHMASEYVEINKQWVILGHTTANIHGVQKLWGHILKENLQFNVSHSRNTVGMSTETDWEPKLIFTGRIKHRTVGN